MAQFRMLADHYINGQILSVGSIQFTADVPGGLLPASWVPTGDSEPLDSAALTLFYSAGPQFPGVIRAQRADDIYAVKLPAT